MNYLKDFESLTLESSDQQVLLGSLQDNLEAYAYKKSGIYKNQKLKEYFEFNTRRLWNFDYNSGILSVFLTWIPAAILLVSSMVYFLNYTMPRIDYDFSDYLVWIEISVSAFLFGFLVSTSTISNTWNFLKDKFTFSRKKRKVTKNLDKVYNDPSFQLDFLENSYYNTLIKTKQKLDETKGKLQYRIDKHKKQLADVNKYAKHFTENNLEEIRWSLEKIILESIVNLEKLIASIIKVGDLADSIKDGNGYIGGIKQEMKSVINANKLKADIEKSINKTITMNNEVNFINTVFINHIEEIVSENIPKIISEIDVQNEVSETMLNI